MKTQFSEKNNINEEFIKIMGDKIYDVKLNFDKKANIKFLIRFYKIYKEKEKPVTFYNAFFMRNDDELLFDIVKVDSVELDGKFYQCGFRRLPEVDTYKYINDKFLITHGWVENNKKILYIDLNCFVIFYDRLKKFKRKRNNLVGRILLKIIAMH